MLKTIRNTSGFEDDSNPCCRPVDNQPFHESSSSFTSSNLHQAPIFSTVALDYGLGLRPIIF